VRRINLADDEKPSIETAEAGVELPLEDFAIAPSSEQLLGAGGNEDYMTITDDIDMADSHPPPNAGVRARPYRRRWQNSTEGEDAPSRLYHAWRALLPELEKPLLRFWAANRGPQPRPPPATITDCDDGSCVGSHAVICVYWDRE
jgi:hypothetical protein